MGELGEIITRELTQKGWTQETLAEVMSLSPQYVSDIIRGRRVPPTRTVFLLSAALMASADSLILAALMDRDPDLYAWLLSKLDLRRLDGAKRLAAQ